MLIENLTPSNQTSPNVEDMNNMNDDTALLSELQADQEMEAADNMMLEAGGYPPNVNSIPTPRQQTTKSFR